jgi:hypothetical protein
MTGSFSSASRSEALPRGGSRGARPRAKVIGSALRDRRYALGRGSVRAAAAVWTRRDDRACIHGGQSRRSQGSAGFAGASPARRQRNNDPGSVIHVAPRVVAALAPELRG